MKHDFETLLIRKNKGSGKWDDIYKYDASVPDDIVPLSVADMELLNAPEIIEGLKEHLDNIILGYTSPTDAYFSSVISWMKRRHSWEIEKDWIVPFNGVVAALFNAVRAYTEPGEGVIVMPPVYYPFFWSVEMTGRKIVRNPLIDTGGDYEIDFADLEEKTKDPANKLLIFCSPHNPVGKVWSKDALEKLGRICIDNGVTIISDEIHFDLILPGHEHTVFSSISDEFAEHSIICTAPSKTFNLAGMHTSNIVIKNAELRKKFEDARCPGFFSLGALGYKACELAYDRAESWLDDFLVVLDGNRQFVEDFISEHLPMIKVRRLEGTYLQWWDCRALNMGNEEMEKFMKDKAHLFLDEGYIFDEGGTCGSGFERINLACPRHVLEAAMERLRRAVESR